MIKINHSKLDPNIKPGCLDKSKLATHITHIKIAAIVTLDFKDSSQNNDIDMIIIATHDFKDNYHYLQYFHLEKVGIAK